MARKRERKLNHFMVSTPSGVVLTTDWLEEQGISSKLAWWYVRSGLLERLGMKAYKKAGDNITWAGVVAALQSQMHLPIHVGGKTALQILGRSHFIPMQGIKQITLFADHKTKAPSWLRNKKQWDAEFEIFRTSLFGTEDKLLGIVERPVEGITLQMSCPERAAMEIVYLYPKYQSLEELALLIENLAQLRPAVVQLLLEKCNSIKVKRLFLYLAEKFQHPWLSNLNFRKINLGRGKRVIGAGGKYDSKYKLSVPEIAEE
jgi:hypothetical protein